MRTNALLSAVVAVVFTAGVSAQVSWLDRPLNNNWNTGNGVLPQAPRTLAPIEGICRDQIRAPESLADRAVTRAGWSLYGPSQSYGPTTVVTAMASVDGMCRPTQVNGFVFVRDRFVGTLAPAPMTAREDGSLRTVELRGANELSANFNRYTSRDALCCPSQQSNVTYSISTGPRPILKADDVNTNPICREDGGGVGIMDNVVAGTVTYRQRSALPPGAVLTVRIVDVSRQDASGTMIAQRQIETGGRQAPFPFDLAFDPDKINPRSQYAVQAEIRDQNRLLFINDTRYPVITQGNPKSVEIVVVPVGAGGPGGGGNRDTVVRGTVTYRQRIALPANSEVKVRLVDAATPEGTPVAETSVSTGNRQVPYSFELPYEMRDINRQREYVLFAEIRSDGRLRFRNETGVPVTLRGNQDQNIEIVVDPASDEPEAITGRTLSLSGFGTGSLQIGTRGSELLIRAAVSVQSDGNASVTVTRPFGGSVTFSGKLTAFDSNSLTITVQNSGEADASGTIQVAYSGRSLRSITAANLMLDGQGVSLRF